MPLDAFECPVKNHDYRILVLARIDGCSCNVFVGAGPWFHGNNEVRGEVNNSFEPQRGYKGAKPNRGEKAEPAKRVDSAHFKGNQERDGRGHANGGKG